VRNLQHVRSGLGDTKGTCWGTMRVSASLFWIIEFIVVACAVFFASTVTLSAADASPDVNLSCRIPFEQLKDPKTGEPFPLSAALNEGAKLSTNLRQRYIVADLNSVDESGNCRGVQEYFSSVGHVHEYIIRSTPAENF
jgi:hypothetical protein